jgi:hypothetical protein
MKLQRYDIQLVYKPGKEMYVADALSRAYLKHSDDNWFAEDFEVNTLCSPLPVSNEKLTELRSATADDTTLQVLKTMVLLDGQQNNLTFQSRYMHIGRFVMK